jgi:hypothetical protein
MFESILKGSDDGPSSDVSNKHDVSETGSASVIR